MGLGKDPAVLKRYQESEILHARWAMLGVTGMLITELLGLGDWVEAPKWVNYIILKFKLVFSNI